MGLSLRLIRPAFNLDQCSAALLPKSILNAPKKQTIIRVQWLVVTIASYVVLFADQLLLPQDAIHAFVLFYILGAASFYFVDRKRFESSALIGAIVVVDTLALSFALIVTDQLGSDFYLSYFLIIIIAGFWKDFRWSFAFALIFSVFYSSLLLLAESVTTNLLLRVPFMFIASIFYSYFVHVINDEQTLRHQAETDARRDFLTGLPNRYAFDERMALEVERAQRYSRPLSVLMADIDNFKLVNDTFGHECGDIVLQNVAAQLRHSLRNLDFVARIGGEEFVVILPETDGDCACEAANRLLANVRENPIQTAKGLLPITISVGVSSGTVSDQRQMLLEADQALYAAKNTGKNRFEAYRPTANSTIPLPAMSNRI